MAGTASSSPARKLSAGRLALALATALILLFLVAPIVVVFPLSLSSGELLVLPTPGYSLRWYEDFFSSSRWLSATWNSFVVGIATMILATLLGTLAAFGIFLGRFPGKALLLAILSLPMVTPVIVTAIAMYFSLSLVGLGSTLTGLILAHTVLSVPFVLLTVLASLQTFDQNLLRAAASLGANPAIAFRRVVLPLIAPGVATGALFAFATSFDELIVALFIASPGQFTLPRQMYAGLREFLSPTIAAAAVLLILFSVLLLALNEFIRKRAQARGASPSGPTA
ncbi:putative spermidine/putrescine transport system permease protein [Bosea sp. 62]|uniref:ABC transporter permease n=1 Tax=unclassified Bosea (in: a-proteobacteria) TaxID=2653178 RepID=UPI001253DDB1|nr:MULTISPECIES: ABC transporter permease [unclassified Bosea (in: a-proteobacteria)]CAD5251663.1 putative spermidine/putrescine transport system permease protein [Bosea sp. 21B]CAD5261683.1 putative spermidine/putrescine transport system permease protein [Bosea sp. 7B]CAD5272993.1 putative spermidine/putrescine transport system permease protein [Bosea sp. 46]VVT43484.1 putative spermidine/putrescine transport system permease protein [Bosea sp. EC-HK365B]VXB25480.1 putative spermidine/putresci